MPIYAPGIRRKGSYAQSAKRDVVAVLQLTAMVDMFTVLVVFLLQNYAVTNQILPISEKIALPQANEVRELKPSHVVLISDGIITLNELVLGSLSKETSDSDWVFLPLREKMVELMQMAQEGGSNFLLAQLKQLSADPEDENIIKQAPFRVTIQADENTQFLDVKKVMYTLTEAGVREMNFAVIKTTDVKFNKERNPQ
ncbi:MAG: biopolymer transporter ExbD [Bdellovibrionaceae bacterium]|nr:biopolymer transporter ExbD [Pseudobdellovibrionaceae bacterium]